MEDMYQKLMDGKILMMIQDMNYSSYSENMLRIQQEADADREF